MVCFMTASFCGVYVLVTSASARTITLQAGDDFEAKCLHVVQPGDTCYLGEGDYKHDGLTVTHGTAENRITITGDSSACIRGSNTQDRMLQIAHDYYTVTGLCFNGQHGDEYVATAIYVLGADRKSTKNGVKSAVTGLQLFNLEIKNFYSECIHFRYFVTHAEVSGCFIERCGKEDFEEGGGGKVGEGIYLGTALDQVNDNKAPEIKLRSGSADNVSADVCTKNWIHHNTFRTYGNECVDVKEGSTDNLIEYNVCEKQRDSNSGGFGTRGSGNTIRYNTVNDCVGAGVRVGGDKGYGGGNNIYGNKINKCKKGAFNVMAKNQGTVCANTVSNVGVLAVGEYRDDQDQDQFSVDVATGDCSRSPGDIVDSYFDTEQNPGTTVHGINGANAIEPEIGTIETSAVAGSPVVGSCASSSVKITKISYLESFADNANAPNNLIDNNVNTYFSVKRESTSFNFTLEQETLISSIGIGVFKKKPSEDRIQTFSVMIRGEDDDDTWRTPISETEADGTMEVQNFQFTPREALYVNIFTHGNGFNKWSALTEVEVCAEPTTESNALFDGIDAVKQEVFGYSCLQPGLLGARTITGTGSDDKVKNAVDGDFKTRWTTQLTTDDSSDLSNGHLIFEFLGEKYVSTIEIAFFDGDQAAQYFSVYTQSASDDSWTAVDSLINKKAAKNVNMQSFDINLDGVALLYIVGRGNDVGEYSKFSEIKTFGC